VEIGNIMCVRKITLLVNGKRKARAIKKTIDAHITAKVSTNRSTAL